MADTSNHHLQLSSTLLYPQTAKDVLAREIVGKDVRDLAGPAVVIDVALVKKHCSQMLDTARALGAGFRAHVKTHKTAELSRLQVGDDAQSPALFVVSTVAEAEGLLPVLQEYKSRGRQVNVLYGIAPSLTCFGRLGVIRDSLGPDSVSFMIDHPAQIDHIAKHYSDGPVPIFIKTDAGYGRAGLTTTSDSLVGLLEHAFELRSAVRVLGFYTHLGSSYGASTPDEALGYLSTELEEALAAADAAYRAGFPADTSFVLSVGATPTTVSSQNLLGDNLTSDAAKRAKALLQKLSEKHEVELHAGVYPVLDLQQLATHARPLTSAASPTITSEDIAIHVLAEVLSVYTERGRPEALIGAGVVALGREPCKSYPGWAIVAPAPWEETKHKIYDPEDGQTGWIVGRVAQEHGILTWEGDTANTRELRVGEKLLLWPNHACLTCSSFGWCTIVDSSREPGRRTEVVDVWPRWRGW